MMELLALPEYDAPPRTLADWSAALADAGHVPRVVREGSGVAWLEVAPLRLRGYAVVEGANVTAVNFELNDPDSEPAQRLIEDAARALGWSVHPDEDDEEEDEEAD